MNTAYIYRLTNKEGLQYIGSHLIPKNKTLYTDDYSGSSQDPRINKGIVCKEILCYKKSEDRHLLYETIQLIEHNLILDLDAINNSDYANATSMGIIGLNYKRLGAIASNKSQKLKPGYMKLRSRAGKLGAAGAAYLRTSDWHRKGQLASAKSRRDNWSKELYDKIIEAHNKYPSKKAYALWTLLSKPTKSYKSIVHILDYIKSGKTWEEIA